MALKLERLEGIVRTYKEIDDPGERAIIDQQVAAIRGFLATDLPALSDSDQAAVAWYIAEMLAGILNLPLSRVSDLLLDTASAYGITTASLLGWLPKGGEAQ